MPVVCSRPLSYFTLILLLGNWIGQGINPGSVQAQVRSDGTMGTSVSQTGSNFTINGGTRPNNGPNLFHSFSQFSVPSNGAAIFNNAATVETIFARVTGGSASQIDGLIQANGNASLFLLNPAGILFGPNARLNIGGSFVGTTANSIQFADGTAFSATSTAGTPLLTVSVPLGLQMGQNPGPITVQGSGNAPILGNVTPLSLVSPSGLQVRPGRSLALLGGDITFVGGEVGAWGGNVELGSVRGAATVQIVPTSSGFTFSYGNVPTLGNIHLAQQALINVGSGSLQIQGQTVKFTEGSMAVSQNIGSQPGGKLVIRGTDRIEFSGTMADGTGRSAMVSEAFGTGSGSRLVISTRQLELRDGAVLGTRTFSSAIGGEVEVNASTSVSVHGFRPDQPNEVSLIANGSLASGKAGNVTLNTPVLFLRDGGSLSSVNFGTGTGGNLQVNTQATEIVGSSSALSNSGITATNLGTGSAGTVTLNTRLLRIASGGAISTTSINDGRAGDITVRALDEIVVSGNFAGLLLSTITSSVVPAPLVFQQLYGLPAVPKGQAGNVTITTRRLHMTDGAALSVANLGLGNAGNLKVSADTVSLDRGGKLEAVTLTGEGGNINIQAQFLALRHSSQIATTAGGAGNGGNITINAPVIAGFENSDIVANAVKGRGGNIQITTKGIFGLKFRPQLTPENDITASSQFGVSGTVTINDFGIDPGTGLVKLSTDLVDSSQKIATGCGGNQGSSFVATGRGGVPENPTHYVNDDRTWDDIRDLSAYRSREPSNHPTNAQIHPSSSIIEATTWQRNPDGSIELIANRTPTVLPNFVNCSGQAETTASAAH